MKTSVRRCRFDGFTIAEASLATAIMPQTNGTNQTDSFNCQ